MFPESLAALCQRSHQYLIKWVESCRLAMKRRKVGKTKFPHKKQKAEITKKSVVQNEEAKNRFKGRQVAPYSAAHTRWLGKDFTLEKDGQRVDD